MDINTLKNYKQLKKVFQLKGVDDYSNLYYESIYNMYKSGTENYEINIYEIIDTVKEYTFTEIKNYWDGFSNLNNKEILYKLENKYLIFGYNKRKIIIGI